MPGFSCEGTESARGSASVDYHGTLRKAALMKVVSVLIQYFATQQVILVGGSTRIPAVQNVAKECMCEEPPPYVRHACVLAATFGCRSLAPSSP